MLELLLLLLSKIYLELALLRDELSLVKLRCDLLILLLQDADQRLFDLEVDAFLKMVRELAGLLGGRSWADCFTSLWWIVGSCTGLTMSFELVL